MSDHIERANDSFKQMNFFVEIDGIIATGFRNVTGLRSEWTVTEERNGNEPPRMRKQRGLEKFDNIVLKAGVTSESGELEAWQTSGVRKSMSIVQLNHNREEVKRWNIVEAFPVVYQPIEGMDAMNESDVQIETMEIAHEGFAPGVTV